MSVRTGLIGLLAPDETTRRAFEETLADWREDRARATSLRARTWSDAQGCLSLLRVILGETGRELAAPDAWRVFAWTVLLSVIVAMANPLNWLYRPRDVLAPGFPEAFALGWLLVPNSLALAFTLVSALGPGRDHGRRASALANVALSLVFMTVLLGWITPAANQEFRLRVAALSEPKTTASSAARVPAPGLNELALPDLVQRAVADRGNVDGARRAFGVRLALLLGAPTGFLLGAAVRQRLGTRVHRRLSQVLGTAALIAAVIAANYLWPLLRGFLPWPTAVRLDRLNAELWLALAVAWAAVLALAWNPRTLIPTRQRGARNQTREP